LCWDTFDINEETPTGSGTTHATHGILIQELSSSTSDWEQLESRPPVEVKHRKKRSITYMPMPLPICYSSKRVKPILNVTGIVTGVMDLPIAAFKEHAWIICRSLFNDTSTVPDWAGWVSKVAVQAAHTAKSVIGYMAPLMAPITDYSTVQECLVRTKEATEKLGQRYAFVTMDLAAAKSHSSRRIPHNVFVYGCYGEDVDWKWI